MHVWVMHFGNWIWVLLQQPRARMGRVGTTSPHRRELHPARETGRPGMGVGSGECRNVIFQIQPYLMFNWDHIGRIHAALVLILDIIIFLFVLQPLLSGNSVKTRHYRLKPAFKSFAGVFYPLWLGFGVSCHSTYITRCSTHMQLVKRPFFMVWDFLRRFLLIQCSF